MGSSSGDFCKVVKVVATSPPHPSSTSSSATSSSTRALTRNALLPSPTTRLMSLPEFEGKLEKLKTSTAITEADEEVTVVKALPQLLLERVSPNWLKT